jgi:hypothetical protein
MEWNGIEWNQIAIDLHMISIAIDHQFNAPLIAIDSACYSIPLAHTIQFNHMSITNAMEVNGNRMEWNEEDE